MIALQYYLRSNKNQASYFIHTLRVKLLILLNVIRTDYIKVGKIKVVELSPVPSVNGPNNGDGRIQFRITFSGFGIKNSNIY